MIDLTFIRCYYSALTVTTCINILDGNLAFQLELMNQVFKILDNHLVHGEKIQLSFFLSCSDTFECIF